MNTIQGDITARSQGSDPKKLAMLLNLDKRKPNQSGVKKAAGFIAVAGMSLSMAWMVLQAVANSKFSRPSDHAPPEEIENPIELFDCKL